MALHCSSSVSAPTFTFNSNVVVKQSFSSTSISFRNPKSYPTLTINCRAAKSVNNKKTSSSPSKTSKKKKKKKNSVVEFDASENRNKDYEIVRELPVEADAQNFGTGLDLPLKYDDDDMLLPRPPTGFLVGDDGVVSLTSANRLVTIQPSIGVFGSENIQKLREGGVYVRMPGRHVHIDRKWLKYRDLIDGGYVIFFYCRPVYIVKNTVKGWTEIREEEIESVLPAAAFALAKIHMHLVYSGYFYTARGGICYTEQDILEFETDGTEDIEGLPTDGVEITYFDLEGTIYLIFTPSKPLEFVIVKGENGLFQVAEADLLDDYAVIDAIDEETEFNALVVEEAAFIAELLDESENVEEDAFIAEMLDDSENEI